MIVIGLTGSIGMGKTTAANMLTRLGCPVHDSDAAVHAALAPGGAGFEETAVTFPECWDKRKHVIRRDVLAEIVFADTDKKAELEEILHPIVRREQRSFLKKQKTMGRKIVALDIPLLFETGAENHMDWTICVTAPYFMQRRRVLSRPGMDEDRFYAIINAQMPDVEKRARADFIVHTGLGYAHTFESLKNILKEIT